MSVDIFSPNVGGAAAPFAYFADSFNRVDQPSYIGNNWGICFYDGDVQTNASLAQTEFNVSALSLVITQSGAGNTPKFIAYPLVFNGQVCWGKSQFAEIQVQAINAANNTTRPGPAVMARMNDASAYFMELDNTGAVTTYAVQRWVNNVPTVIIGARSYTIGETLRIEAVVSSSSVIINTYRNGVLDATATDSSGSRLQAGNPAIFGIGMLVNLDSITFNNFKCGTLPQMRTDTNFP